VHTLVDLEHDAVQAITALADVVAEGVEPVLAAPQRPERPTGALTVQNLAETIGAVLPDDAIISDEANTSGIMLPAATAGAPKHDVLTLTGGAIGDGMAIAVGAAVACPDRPVLCLEADGSAMYGPAALWTMAREQLDVTTVVINNSAYAILRMELGRVGAEAGGPKAAKLLDLSSPDLDFVALATGMGVPASKATTAEELAQQLENAFAEPGPHLIEAVVPPLMS
jgi:acetolactate synthase-1/2/3 large subunit